MSRASVVHPFPSGRSLEGMLKPRTLLCLLLLPAFVLVDCKDSQKPNPEDDLNTDFNVPIAAITMDGNADDWAGIAPAAMDAQGDDTTALSGADAKGLYIAQSPDRSTIYVMMNFWDGPPDSLLASGSTTDGDSPTSRRFDGISGLLRQQQRRYSQRRNARALRRGFGRLVRLQLSLRGILTPCSPLEDVLEYAFPWTAIGSPAQTYVLGCVNYSAWNDRREYVPDFPQWVRLHIAN